MDFWGFESRQELTGEGFGLLKGAATPPAKVSPEVQAALDRAAIAQAGVDEQKANLEKAELEAKAMKLEQEKKKLANEDTILMFENGEDRDIAQEEIGERKAERGEAKKEKEDAKKANEEKARFNFNVGSDQLTSQISQERLRDAQYLSEEVSSLFSSKEVDTKDVKGWLNKTLDEAITEAKSDNDLEDLRNFEALKAREAVRSSAETEIQSLKAALSAATPTTDPIRASQRLEQIAGQLSFPKPADASSYVRGDSDSSTSASGEVRPPLTHTNSQGLQGNGPQQANNNGQQGGSFSVGLNVPTGGGYNGLNTASYGSGGYGIGISGGSGGGGFGIQTPYGGFNFGVGNFGFGGPVDNEERGRRLDAFLQMLLAALMAGNLDMITSAMTIVGLKAKTTVIKAAVQVINAMQSYDKQMNEITNKIGVIAGNSEAPGAGAQLQHLGAEMQGHGMTRQAIANVFRDIMTMNEEVTNLEKSLYDVKSREPALYRWS